MNETSKLEKQNSSHFKNLHINNNTRVGFAHLYLKLAKSYLVRVSRLTCAVCSGSERRAPAQHQGLVFIIFLISLPWLVMH